MVFKRLAKVIMQGTGLKKLSTIKIPTTPTKIDFNGDKLNEELDGFVFINILNHYQRTYLNSKNVSVLE